MPFNKHPFNAPSNGTSGGYALNKDADLSFENESVSERGWEMSEESGLVDDGMHDSALVVHDDDLTLDDLNQASMLKTSMSAFGSEVQLFAQYLDDMRNKADSHLGDKTTSEKAAFQIIETYRQIAEERLHEHESIMGDLDHSPEKKEIDGHIHARDASGQYIDLTELEENCDNWVVELQTWDLLSSLSKHRLSRGEHTVSDSLAPGVNKHSSDLRFREHLMVSDPQFKEINIIMDWVQRYAPTPKTIVNTRGAGWAYTKQSVKQLKLQREMGGEIHQRIPDSPGGEFVEDHDLVTELDPDAPTRQGKFIEPEDSNFDNKLMAVIFQHLRKGDIGGAMEKCRHFSQFWRAQTLAGGYEAWDAALDGPKEGRHGLEGNVRRELWRRMCYKLACETPAWEGAVYGILSGDLDSVLEMCETWEDHLFAHLNSLIETQYFDYLASHHRIPATVQKFPIYDAVQHHGGPDAKFLPRIIDNLRNTSKISEEANQAQRLVQGGLISERLSDILAELSRQLELLKRDSHYDPSTEERDLKGLDISDIRLLRVVVHIVLVLKSLGAGFAPSSQEWKHAEDVVAGYMELLAVSGRYDLVPLYAGQITKHRASREMGEILVKVTSEATRVQLLGLMKQYNIDIPEALKRMISTVFEHTAPVYLKLPLPNWTGILSPRTTGIHDHLSLTEEDETLIRALEWMLLVPELKGQMMQDGCVVYKRFLLTGRLAAARELYKRIPSTILIPTSDRDMVDSFENMDAADSDLGAALRDTDEMTAEHARHAALYMEFEMFVRGIMALEEWKEAMQKVFENKRDRMYKNELEQAYESIQSYTLPISKTWLLGSLVPSPMDQAEQLQSIRNTYIPDLILALHNVYSDAGRYLRKNLLTQTLELASVVGSNSNDGQQILRCFVETGKLREYVDNIAEASRMILGAAQTSSREISKKGTAGGGGASLQIWNVQ